MELSKNYIPGEVETKWYQHWIDQGYFHSEPNHKPAYTVVIPPPNVTGVLHMGHCLNNTIQDILVRRARMQGMNPCWVPGTDHASIATEAKVVAMLRERGIAKSSLSRDEFLTYAWEWKEKYGGIILQQLRKMGCSLDWDRTSFTMDPDYYETVIKVFVDLYNKGKIYRGKRMINWDVRAKTALSDEEVIHKEVNGKMYHIRYKLDVPGEEYITVATVRPETIFGDTAICVHPKDDRYKHLVGQHAFVPMINRRIPIIADDYIEMEFGTGALKVTPAHDINDFNLGQKHGLEVIETLNEDGTMARLPELKKVAEKFDLKIISIEALVAYRMQNDSLIAKKNDFQIETRFGSYRLRAYQQTTNDAIHIALTKGDWNTGETIPTRINSTLVNNDVLGTLTNDADKKLDEMFRVSNKKGKGAIVFINQNSSPEKTLKRLNVLKDIQQDGTVVKAPSINMDEKDFGIGAQILHDLNIQKLNLISNSKQKKRVGMIGYGLEIIDYINY